MLDSNSIKKLRLLIGVFTELLFTSRETVLEMLL